SAFCTWPRPANILRLYCSSCLLVLSALQAECGRLKVPSHNIGPKVHQRYPSPSRVLISQSVKSTLFCKLLKPREYGLFGLGFPKPNHHFFLYSKTRQPSQVCYCF